MRFRFSYIVSLLLLLPSTAVAENPLTIHQETHGNQSPAINAGRDVHLSYIDGLSYKDLLEMTRYICGDLQKMRTSMEENANAEAEKLRAALKRTFAVADVSPEDAQRRAQQFIDTLPVRKEKLKSQDEDLQKLNQKAKDKALEKSKKLEVQLEYLFNNVFRYIDPFVSSLEKDNKIKAFETNNIPIIYHDTNYPAGDQRVRNIIFNNGSTIEVSMSPGRVENGLLLSYPSLYFKGTVGGLNYLSFSILKFFRGRGMMAVYSGGNNPVAIKEIKPRKISDVKYYPEAEQLLTENFQKNFKHSFDDLFEQVFVKDSEQGK